MTSLRIGIATWLVAATLATGCGAPTKSAGEVGDLFEGDAVDLQTKVGNLCNTLEGRTEQPTLSDLDLDVNGCADAGKAAQNYNDVSSFQFLGLDGDVPSADKDLIIKKTVRGQLWLNKSLLGFAAAIDAKLAKAKGTQGLFSEPASGKNFDGIIDLEPVEAIEPFGYDADTKLFGGVLRIKGQGIASLDNKIEVRGQLLEGGVAATIKTTEDQVVEKSLVKSMEGLIVIMPHAGDVYVDIYFDVVIHNLGFPGLFRELLGGIMGGGLKLIADALLAD